MRVETPWGSLDVRLTPTGPALNHASTGAFVLVDGVPNHEFALREVRTSGTLVLDGREHRVGGTSWLDRQWGEMPTSLARWTWMNLAMCCHREPGPGDRDPDGSGYLEAAASFTGKYDGKDVRGENYVEMTGEWNS
ncbi:lipocalin-like domain-containing protein [Saccharothrix sp. Mg75]|uniref:lipocalin-like domain-containing protein n=1 Tax=Saccharothrix sp. Mg75 TaxID=3445357 RepID=UPI003EEEC5EF